MRVANANKTYCRENAYKRLECITPTPYLPGFNPVACHESPFPVGEGAFPRLLSSGHRDSSSCLSQAHHLLVKVAPVASNSPRLHRHELTLGRR